MEFLSDGLYLIVGVLLTLGMAALFSLTQVVTLSYEYGRIDAAIEQRILLWIPLEVRRTDHVRGARADVDHRPGNLGPDYSSRLILLTQNGEVPVQTARTGGAEDEDRRNAERINAYVRNPALTPLTLTCRRARASFAMMFILGPILLLIGFAAYVISPVLRTALDGEEVPWPAFVQEVPANHGRADEAEVDRSARDAAARQLPEDFPPELLPPSLHVKSFRHLPDAARWELHGTFASRSGGQRRQWLTQAKSMLHAAGWQTSNIREQGNMSDLGIRRAGNSDEAGEIIAYENANGGLSVIYHVPGKRADAR